MAVELARCVSVEKVVVDTLRVETRITVSVTVTRAGTIVEVVLTVEVSVVRTAQ